MSIDISPRDPLNHGGVSTFLHGGAMVYQLPLCASMSGMVSRCSNLLIMSSILCYSTWDW